MSQWVEFGLRQSGLKHKNISPILMFINLALGLKGERIPQKASICHCSAPSLTGVKLFWSAHWTLALAPLSKRRLILFPRHLLQLQPIFGHTDFLHPLCMHLWGTYPILLCIPLISFTSLASPPGRHRSYACSMHDGELGRRSSANNRFVPCE